MDGDGLSDDLEEMILKTDKNNKYGDKDSDGLYDFEEYLDYYGSNDTSNQVYDYNDSMSGEDGVLDIYHLFNLSSNKTGYLRDQSFTEANGGFTDYLLWNVSFTAAFAGGSIAGDVNYSGNTMTDVSFTTSFAGGSSSGNVTYSGNTMTNVSFVGAPSGGSNSGDITYNGNTMTNVSFVGAYSGGSETVGDVNYTGNTMTDVSFAGFGSGGTDTGNVNYTENTISNIIVSGNRASKSRSGISSYIGNLIVNDSNDADIDGLGDGWEVIYANSTGVDPLDTAIDSELSFDMDGDGLNLTAEFKAKTNPGNNDTDGDGLNDGWEVTYANGTGVDPLDTASDSELSFDMDSDGLNLTAEFKANTNPSLNDTDGDGLNDGWEVTYASSTGVDPLDTASDSELSFDMDSDGLNLAAESIANTDPGNADTDGDGLSDDNELTLMTDPTLNDTDGDGLDDKWEVTYNGASGVNPLVNVTDTELSSDMDDDGLTLLQEFQANTDPASSDTDGDGLDDKWEVTYNDASDVNPVVAATSEELASDIDNDNLTLLQEFQANTDPASNDTDGDGLDDKWEVTYNGASGVNPVVAATSEELASDIDNDGLTLLQEFQANTDPETADNPMTTNTVTNTPESDSGTSGESVFVLVVMVILFISFGIMAVILYRVR